VSELIAVTTLAAAAAPLVNWSGLLKVLALAVGTAVVIVGGFSLGLAALDVHVSSLRAQQAADGAGEAVAGASPAVRYGSLAMAVLLFAVCVAGVVVGLIEMVSK
jgi:hypothetical protein